MAPFVNRTQAHLPAAPAAPGAQRSPHWMVDPPSALGDILLAVQMLATVATIAQVSRPERNASARVACAARLNCMQRAAATGG